MKDSKAKVELQLTRKWKYALLVGFLMFAAFTIFFTCIGAAVEFNHPHNNFGEGATKGFLAIGVGVGSVIGAIAGLIAYNETTEYRY